MLKYCVAGFVLLPIVYAQTTVVEYGCFDYVLLDLHGVRKHYYCNVSEVFDPASMKCIVPRLGEWPCTDVKDCTDAENKKYVDVTPKEPARHCKSYYTCHNGYFYGHNYCPGTTVFNQEQQYCDWITNVKPPCGTFDP